MALPIVDKLKCLWSDGTLPPVTPPSSPDLQYAIGSSIRYQIDNYWGNGTARDVSRSQGRLVVWPGYGVSPVLDIPWTVDVNVPSRAYVDIWPNDLLATDPATYKAQIVGSSGGVIVPLGPLGFLSAYEMGGIVKNAPDLLTRPIATLLVLFEGESSKLVEFDQQLDTSDYVIDYEIALDVSGDVPSQVIFAPSLVAADGFVLNASSDFHGLVRVTIYPRGTTAFPPLPQGSRILQAGIATFAAQDTVEVSITELPFDDYTAHPVPLLDTSTSPGVIPVFYVLNQTKKKFTLVSSATYTGPVHWSLHEALL